MNKNENKRTPRTLRTTLMALGLCAALIVGFMAGCSKTENPGDDGSPKAPAEDTGLKLNLYQPHQAQAALWQELAADYKTITGVNVNVITATTGDAASQLKEMFSGEGEKPAIFLFSSPREYKAWQDNALDITNNAAYGHLIDSRLALTANGKTIAIPVGVEAFGIIYNKKVLDSYFALETKGTQLKSMDDVKSYKELEALAKDLNENKDKLGIGAAFASPALKAGESTVWTTRMLGVPLGYELEHKKIDVTGDDVNEITLHYDKGYKGAYDLILGYGTADKAELESRAHAEAVTEFASGKAAMILGGTEFLGHLNSAVGQTVNAEDCCFLPLYMDIEGADSQSLAFEAVDYAAVNSKLTDEEIQAAGEFLNWLFTSEKGMDFLANKLGVLAPYDTVTEERLPKNPLSAKAFEWLKKEGVTGTVTYSALSPGDDFRDKVMTSGLLAYAKGDDDWNKFKSNVKEGWAEFRAKVNESF